jgi:hypothetical protein
MRGPKGSSPQQWWAPGRCGLAGRWWTEVAAGVSRWAVFGAQIMGVRGGIGCGGKMG